MSVESHAEPRGRAGAGAGRGSGPWESLTTVVLSLQGRVSCTGRLMVQAVNQRGRSPRPSAGHPHSRRYVPRPSRALLRSRWFLNPALSAWWGAHREGVLGDSGHVRGSGLPVAGVGTPARRRAQARPLSLTAALQAGPWFPVTTSCLKVCALVTQHTSLPETQTSRPDWPHFGHFPCLQPPGPASMGRRVVPSEASKGLVGCWPGDPARGFQAGWVLEGHRGRGAAGGAETAGSSAPRGPCLCLGGSPRPRARSRDARLQGTTRAQRHRCRL